MARLDAQLLVQTGVDSSGRPWVSVVDTELFHFVEDSLTERYGLEYLFLIQGHGPGEQLSYTMTFPGDKRLKVEAAVASLDSAELRRIYQINNLLLSPDGDSESTWSPHPEST